MLDKIFGALGNKAINANQSSAQQDMFNKALQLNQTEGVDGINIPSLDVNKLKLRGTIDDLNGLENTQGIVAALFSNPQFMNGLMAMIKQKMAV